MGDLANAAAGIEREIDGLNKRLDNLRGDLTGLEMRVGTFDEDMASALNGLVALTARVAALEAPPSPPPGRRPIILAPGQYAETIEDGDTILFRAGDHSGIGLHDLEGVTLAPFGDGEARLGAVALYGRCAHIVIRDLTIARMSQHDNGVLIGPACEGVVVVDCDVSGFATGVRVEGRDVTCERVKSHDNTRMVAIGGGDAAGEHGAQAFAVVGARERPNLGPVRLIDCEGRGNIARDPRISYGGHDGAEVELFHAQNVAIVRYRGEAGEVFIEAAGSTAGVRVRGGVIRDMNLFSFHQADDFKASGIDFAGQGPNWPAVWIGGGNIFGTGGTAGFEFTMNHIRTPGTVWQLVGAFDPTAVLSDNDYGSGGLFGLVGETNCPDLLAWQRATGKDANSTWQRA